MTISFHPLAERELNDAAQYFEHESQGLGAAFLSEVERASTLITEYPEAALWCVVQSADDSFDAFPTPSSMLCAPTRSECWR
jgi:hypothetical protein